MDATDWQAPAQLNIDELAQISRCSSCSSVFVDNGKCEECGFIFSKDEKSFYDLLDDWSFRLTPIKTFHKLLKTRVYKYEQEKFKKAVFIRLFSISKKMIERPEIDDSAYVLRYFEMDMILEYAGKNSWNLKGVIEKINDLQNNNVQRNILNYIKSSERKRSKIKQFLNYKAFDILSIKFILTSLFYFLLLFT